jgi:hypothetical protein
MGLKQLLSDLSADLKNNATISDRGVASNTTTLPNSFVDDRYSQHTITFLTSLALY